MTAHDDDRVEIRICIPHEPVLTVLAKVSSEIEGLQTLWPNHPKIFIYKGCQLIPSMTFEGYGIRDGDSIVVLPQGEGRVHADAAREWMNETRDNDAFNASIGSIINPVTSLQVARLRDLRWAALERRPRQIRHLTSLVMELQQNRFTPSRTIIPCRSPPAPSAEALPFIWNDETDF
jgi:hypothetical protein